MAHELATATPCAEEEDGIQAKQRKTDQTELRQGQPEESPVYGSAVTCAAKHQCQCFFKREVFKHIVKPDATIGNDVFFMRLQSTVAFYSKPQFRS